jgi:ADP-ribose pyrophosphatase YjhB (NUDIX family)
MSPSAHPAAPTTLSFAAGSHRFHLRAAAIVKRGDAVLLHRADGDAFWALPGGRVEAGERAADAVVRELREELDVLVRPLHLGWVVENFFPHDGEQHHEIGLYFVTEARPGTLLLDAPGPYEGREGRRRLVFAWHPIAELPSLDLRPSFLADALAQPEPAIRHIVHRQGDRA